MLNLKNLKSVGYPENILHDTFDGQCPSLSDDFKKYSEPLKESFKNGFTDEQREAFKELINNDLVFTDLMREVIRLRFKEFKTYSEIGKELGFSADKAKYVLGKIENKFHWEFILTRIYK